MPSKINPNWDFWSKYKPSGNPGGQLFRYDIVGSGNLSPLVLKTKRELFCPVGENDLKI
jgi:hypothetical protein